MNLSPVSPTGSFLVRVSPDDEVILANGAFWEIQHRATEAAAHAAAAEEARREAFIIKQEADEVRPKPKPDIFPSVAYKNVLLRDGTFYRAKPPHQFVEVEPDPSFVWLSLLPPQSERNRPRLTETERSASK